MESWGGESLFNTLVWDFAEALPSPLKMYTALDTEPQKDSQGQGLCGYKPQGKDLTPPASLCVCLSLH